MLCPIPHRSHDFLLPGKFQAMSTTDGATCRQFNFLFTRDTMKKNMASAVTGPSVQTPELTIRYSAQDQ